MAIISGFLINTQDSSLEPLRVAAYHSASVGSRNLYRLLELQPARREKVCQLEHEPTRRNVRSTASDYTARCQRRDFRNTIIKSSATSR